MESCLVTKPAACASAASGTKQHRHAFTLVELLTVIAIIGILAALLTPAVSTIKRRAHAAKCVSNIRQISLASYLYGQDHGIYPGWDGDRDRKELLYPYLDTGQSNRDTADDQIWHCPANERIDREASYGINTYLNWQPFARIREPAATVAVADAGITDARESTLATHLMPPSRTTTANIGRPNPRHSAAGQPAAAVAFVDGHVRLLPMDEPFYPGPAGEWTGNGVTDPFDPAYKDEWWDLR